MKPFLLGLFGALVGMVFVIISTNWFVEFRSNSSFEIEFIDFISVLLTGLSVILAALGFVIALLAFVGWTTIADRAQNSARQEVKRLFSEDGELREAVTQQVQDIVYPEIPPIGKRTETDQEDEDF